MRLLVLASVAVTCALAPLANAQGPAPSASTKPIASASAAGSASAVASAAPSSVEAPSGVGAGPLPEGAEEAPLPAGHPRVDQQQEDDGEGGEAEAAAPGSPKIPRDVSNDDARVPKGMIVGRIVDADGNAVAHEAVTLGILRSSVALGEARTQQSTTTDASGNFNFAGLLTGSGWVYRVSIVASGADPKLTATYGVSPFQLKLDQGHMVELHKFPVTGSLDGMMAGFTAVDTTIEVRDDVIEVNQIFQFTSVTPKTWALGDGFTLKLPAQFKGLREAETSNDYHATAIEGVGVKWTGSFPPGQSQLAYDFKLPYSGDEATVDFEAELPTRVIAARVRVMSRKGMSLDVDGFPASKSDTSETGVKVLSTLRQGSPQEPLHTIAVHIKGLPVRGMDRFFAMLGALGAVAIGLFFASRPPSPRSSADTALRARLLAERRRVTVDELELLDRARDKGDVGVEAYATERERLVDALAASLE
ncbi:MAG: carboxypeptidase-like regulatory domain-containing protein [Polyangiales bacterium]